MKALSLWQPWATLIALGVKRFETRHWSTRYRGPIAIHAVARGNLAEEDELLDDLRRRFARCHHLPRAADLPRGAIVAIGRLTDCWDIDRRFIDTQTDLERAVGCWMRGRFAWEIVDVKALDTPVPFPGRRSLFDVPDELLAAQAPARRVGAA